MAWLKYKMVSRAKMNAWIAPMNISKSFQMKSGAAESRLHFTVESGAWLEVMPEPLVPHRGCSYRQTTRIDLALGGGLFFADLLMPGRLAHGEAWEWRRLCLETEVRLGGELI